MMTKGFLQRFKLLPDTMFQCSRKWIRTRCQMPTAQCFKIITEECTESPYSALLLCGNFGVAFFYFASQLVVMLQFVWSQIALMGSLYNEESESADRAREFCCIRTFAFS
ncbi:unnamed protein product [Strongylus vulgaris]|uniref:Uncharacterized protein n=1 Tax=Strongylus vulgaris TaxID=40348 RepID=A0A3P7J5X7_STRVU|nr:unnamed protein product [Strongylus vulgaris]